MRAIAISIGVIAAISAMVTQAVQTKHVVASQASGNSRQLTDRSADEAAIRANVAQYVKAFNAHDAKAITELFAPDAQIVDKDGNTYEGREAIENVFKGVFADSPNKTTEVLVESIRMIGSDLAVEVGTTKEIEAANETPDYDRYTVLHVKRDGKWHMALARDEEGAVPPAHERLQPLAWLVGEWVDDGGSTVVNSTGRWSEDGNFLLLDFKIKINGREAMTVNQRIGWDPQCKCIHAWLFDSEGGFGESFWARDDGSWIIRSTGVRPDGSTGSATNYLTQTGNDGYIWRSTDRIVAGEKQPPVAVKIARKAPEAKN